MLGRSKELVKRCAFSSCRRSAISRWVGGSAVAVSAIRGMSGQRSCSRVSSRYSRRKSWPHCDTQWASSMANRAIFERSSRDRKRGVRSEEHTSELQSLMRISSAVFCLKKKKKNKQHRQHLKQNQTNTTTQHIHR